MTLLFYAIRSMLLLCWAIPVVPNSYLYIMSMPPTGTIRGLTISLPRTPVPVLQQSSPDISRHSPRSMMHPRPEFPYLVHAQSGDAFVLALRQNHKIRVGPGIQRPLDALETQHRRRRGRHGVEGLGHGRSGPVEEVVDALDERDGPVSRVSSLLLEGACAVSWPLTLRQSCQCPRATAPSRP
jgi:hypothetical protein